MSWWQKKSEILGVNARNLSYLMPYNTSGGKDFADDKISTKNYFQSRGIGVARLYAVIRNYKELDNFNPDTLPASFVIKPNRGYGGEGITLIHNRKTELFLGSGKKKYHWADIYRQCSDILDGKYSISGLGDKVIFEELLLPHDYFFDVVEDGLPDVRIVVFNKVPVMAMLRLPSKESGGRANLHLGAIGLGIDIATGTTNHAFGRGRLIKTLANGKPVNSIKVPLWDEILLTAVKVQQASKLGFLGVDLAVTKTGIKVLEINARAGLSIQLATLAPLKPRLTKVADLKIISAEEAVKVAKTLFAKARPRVAVAKPSKPTIGLYEPIEILNTDLDPVTAKIDPYDKRNIVDLSLRPSLTENLMDIKIADKRINLPIEFGDLTLHLYKVILAGIFLGDFLIDISATPTKNKTVLGVKLTAKSTEEKIIKNIDRKIYQIDKKLAILPRFRPINLAAERNLFFDNPTYCPQFIYKKLDLDLNAVKKEIKKIPSQLDHPLVPLYLAKIKELNRKVLLLEARGTGRIQYHSERIYGRVNQELYQRATAYIKNYQPQGDLSEELGLKKIEKILTQALAERKLNHWKIKVLENLAGDIVVNRANTIYLRVGITFTENRLKALVAHEIETHIFRLENARLQNYKIFEVGTAHYILTEEGLAIYNQRLLNLPLGGKMIWPALNVVDIYLGRRMSFVELYQHLTGEYSIDSDEAFKVCVKVKRGLANTEEPSSFSHDHLYFTGEQIINRFVKLYGQAKLKDLYVGKIGLGDLEIIKQAGSFKNKRPTR